MKSPVARDAVDARERYVYIDADGEARELTPKECEYLATPFEPGDGGRPYIKERYDSLTPDGGMHGFLELKNLPPRRRPPVRRTAGRDHPGAIERLERRGRWRRARNTVLAVVASSGIGYLAWVTGAVFSGSLLHVASREVTILLLLALAVVATPFYVLAGVLEPLFSIDRSRPFRFLALLALYFGFLGGAAWALWFNGDPTGMLP